MKLQNLFLLLTLLVLSSNIFANDVSQQNMSLEKISTTQSQWLFNQDGLSFLNERADYVQAQDYIKVFFQNNCYSTVAVVARYMDLDGSWVTDGAWKLVPGEKGYLYDTRNLIMYFYGVSEQGHRWQGNHVVVINGYQVPMQEVRMNMTGYGSFTMNLNCR